MVQRGLCQHQRRQKPDGTAGARCLAHLDEHGATRTEVLHRRRPSKASRCGLPHHIACCEAGLKSQREVFVPTFATDKLTEPRVDVDAWGHPGLPHIRLDFKVVDADALHCSSAMRKDQRRHQLRHKQNERKRTKTRERKESKNACHSQEAASKSHACHAKSHALPQWMDEDVAWASAARSGTWTA